MKNLKDKMKKEIPLFKVFMSDKAAGRASEVINSGFIGEGPQVKEFESELRRYFSSPYYLVFIGIENKENFIFPEIWVKELKDSINKYNRENTTKKVIENYNLNNPQSVSSVFDNDKIIKDLGLDINDLKSTDGKLNFSKGDGYSSGHPNGSEEQLYYYAGKLSSYLYKSGKVEKVISNIQHR